MEFRASTTFECLCPSDEIQNTSESLDEIKKLDKITEYNNDNESENKDEEGYENILLNIEKPPRSRYIQNSQLLSSKRASSSMAKISIPINLQGQRNRGTREPKNSTASIYRRPSVMNFISKGFTESVIDDPDTHFCLKLCCQGWLGILRLIVAIRAILVRCVFVGLTLAFIATVVRIKEERIYWLLCLLVLPLLVDLGYSIAVVVIPNGCKNYTEKWFTKCLLAYLLCACPPIWIIELHHLRQLNIATEAIIQSQAQIHGDDGDIQNPWIEAGLEYNRPGESLVIMGTEPRVFLNRLSKQRLNYTATEPPKLITRVKRQVAPVPVEIPNYISEEKSLILAMTLQHLPLKTAIRLIEQLLLLSVIVGRWLLPRFGISRDQLSQLLLINIGNAADILELFEAFNEDIVRSNHELKICILCLWQASLLQFCFNKTATLELKTPQVQQRAFSRCSIMNDLDSGGGQCVSEQPLKGSNDYRVISTQLSDYDMSDHKPTQSSCCPVGGCCEGGCSDVCKGGSSIGFICFGTEIWAICISLMLQDIPFLALRLSLIFYFKVRSYSNVFFTCKNTLLILLQVFRSVVILVEYRRKKNVELPPSDIPLVLIQ